MLKKTLVLHAVFGLLLHLRQHVGELCELAQFAHLVFVLAVVAGTAELRLLEARDRRPIGLLQFALNLIFRATCFQALLDINIGILAGLAVLLQQRLRRHELPQEFVLRFFLVASISRVLLVVHVCLQVLQEVVHHVLLTLHEHVALAQHVTRRAQHLRVLGRLRRCLQRWHGVQVEIFLAYAIVLVQVGLYAARL